MTTKMFLVSNEIEDLTLEDNIPNVVLLDINKSLELLERLKLASDFLVMMNPEIVSNVSFLYDDVILMPENYPDKVGIVDFSNDDMANLSEDENIIYEKSIGINSFNTVYIKAVSAYEEKTFRAELNYDELMNELTEALKNE